MVVDKEGVEIVEGQDVSVQWGSGWRNAVVVAPLPDEPTKFRPGHWVVIDFDGLERVKVQSHHLIVADNKEQKEDEQPVPRRSFGVDDTIRIPHYKTTGGFRVWKVHGVHLGGTYQEGTYRLVPLDVKDNETIHVPCIILETHPGIERV